MPSPKWHIYNETWTPIGLGNIAEQGTERLLMCLSTLTNKVSSCIRWWLTQKAKTSQSAENKILKSTYPWIRHIKPLPLNSQGAL